MKYKEKYKILWEELADYNKYLANKISDKTDLDTFMTDSESEMRENIRTSIEKNIDEINKEDAIKIMEAAIDFIASRIKESLENKEELTGVWVENDKLFIDFDYFLADAFDNCEEVQEIIRTATSEDRKDDVMIEVDETIITSDVYEIIEKVNFDYLK